MACDRRALVVDDDAGIRILITRILARHGFVVDSARDGAEAIEQVLEHDYDMIVLDLMMPRIDGFGVLKYIDEHRPHLLPRIVVMSAFGNAFPADHLPPVGRYIEKPFDIETLLAQTQRASTRPSPSDTPSRSRENRKS